MKIHQVHFFVNTSERKSLGYEYFTSKKAASARIKEAQHTHYIGEKIQPNGPGRLRFEKHVIDVEISRDGVLLALNTYGGHPDNG